MTTDTITIIEGSTPWFVPARELWAGAILEMPLLSPTVTCQMRTFNVITLMDRCRKAWSAGNSMLLDYPQMDGLRQTMEIVAARPGNVEEGDLLYLWLKEKP